MRIKRHTHHHNNQTAAITPVHVPKASPPDKGPPREPAPCAAPRYNIGQRTAGLHFLLGIRACESLSKKRDRLSQRVAMQLGEHEVETGCTRSADIRIDANSAGRAAKERQSHSAPYGSAKRPRFCARRTWAASTPSQGPNAAIPRSRPAQDGGTRHTSAAPLPLSPRRKAQTARTGGCRGGKTVDPLNGIRLSALLCVGTAGLPVPRSGL